MKYYLIVLLLLCATTVNAQDQEMQITQVAKKIISNTTNIKLTPVTSRVAPQIEQQIRAIADQLAVQYPLNTNTPLSSVPPDTSLSTNNVFARIKNILAFSFAGLAFFILLHYVLKKYDEKKNGKKPDNISTITPSRRNAPCLFAWPMASQTEAETLARDLITKHLIARADLVPQQSLDPNATSGVMLVTQTVKSNLKTLHEHLSAQDISAFPIPIFKGHKAHVQWIINTADGKG